MSPIFALQQSSASVITTHNQSSDMFNCNSGCLISTVEDYHFTTYKYKYSLSFLLYI